MKIADTTKKEITQLVGYFKSPQTGAIHLFFRWGLNSFYWTSCDSYHGLLDIRMASEVKIFPQQPHLELYQAKTWDDAKKWFENC